MKSTSLKRLRELHREVDRLTARLSGIHRERLQCARGCYDCCIDDISVFEIEADLIRTQAPELLATEGPHPVGRCAFLSTDGACRVYELRPYVCRTQGLPLRWIGEAEDGSLAELRDICPLNEDGKPIEELSRDECWSIGPFEERLATLQHAIDEGQGRRVKLRDLFSRQA